MAASPTPPCPPLLDAIAFAARVHRHQVRKDNQTPYVSHVLRVCLVVRHIFGIEDENVLVTAVLHDTVEDTTTDFDDVSERFGEEVAGWVALLSKDKRMVEPEREEAYRAQLSQAPWQVKICKLADMYDNLIDSSYLQLHQRPRTQQRIRGYLNALQSPDLPPVVRRAWESVESLLASMERG
jgi:guanosine-3',5'-bis(diphosphate) 3'-pyrophosphohydrolase